MGSNETADRDGDVSILRYAKIDTQSAEDQPTVPSTKKMFDLARLLEKELKALGVQEMSGSANTPSFTEWSRAIWLIIQRCRRSGLSPTWTRRRRFPVRMLTSIIHKNYQGGDIVLPNDKTQVITVAQNPDLKNLIGDDIITADGTTLLGFGRQIRLSPRS